jgi:CubicO group peptidase (beta-lactamase class C family)
VNPSSRSLRIALAAAGVAAAVAARAADPLPRASPETVGMSSQRLARIEPSLKAEIRAGNFPGAVVMVARKGKLVYSAAIGEQDPAAKTPYRSTPSSGSTR